MHKYIWLVPLLPLLGAAINGLFGRKFRFSETLIGGIAVGSVALAFLISVAAVLSYGFGSHALWPAPYLTSQDGFSFDWIPGGAVQINHGLQSGFALLNVEWSYQLDPLSSIFMLIVTGVGLCIFIFATGYMHGEAGFYRFFAYMGLFMFAMLVLVMGSNFLMMFVGWEGVGLCSYLLIGYYFDRQEAANASRKAFITNRIGDFGFALAIFGIIATFGSAQYTQVFEQAKAYPLETLGHWGVLSWIALGLFIGACGKSAQLPLHVWLPDAMAGPTPVSALIHAATMVTAGVYMIVRCSEIFVHAPTAMFIVAIIGAATALFAATIGLAQNDIKKVLAYSTISQLGYMFLACGVGAFIAAIFHVITHAFFKALLFLGSGSVIHGMHHEQDMRRMGGLKKYMPITFATMFAGWLAISGIPVFAGFFSKDEILWKTWSAAGMGSFAKVLWAIGALTALLTAIYMTRMMVMTFWGEERFRNVQPMHHEHEEKDNHHGPTVPHESPWSMTIPLIVLAILSTIGGFIGVPYAFVNRDINVIEHTLEPAVAKMPASETTEHTDEHAHVGEERALAGVSIVIAGLGIGVGWYIFRRRPLLEMPRILENKYYVDEIYDTTLIRPIEAGSREGLWKIFDIGVIDGTLHALGDAVTELGRLARWLQAGFVRAYAAIILIGALILIGLFAYFGFPLAR